MSILKPALCFFLFCSLGVSAQTETQQEPQEVSTTVQLPIPDATQLIADAHPKEAVWLDTSEGKWLAFYKITEWKETKGVLLMLHASEKPERWPATLELLRRHLPLSGWETFALAIPAERITDKTLSQLLDAAITYLRQNGKFNAVLLSDNRLIDAAALHLRPQIKPNPGDPKTVDGPIQAMIILNMQAQYPLTQDMLEGIFSTAELPVLDIFFQPAFVNQKNNQRLHKTTAARKKLLKYRQQIFPYPKENTLNENQQFWIAAVRGFMDREAQGTEIKDKQKTPESP
jgi:hypothetical protein